MRGKNTGKKHQRRSRLQPKSSEGLIAEDSESAGSKVTRHGSTAMRSSDSQQLLSLSYAGLHSPTGELVIRECTHAINLEYAMLTLCSLYIYNSRIIPEGGLLPFQPDGLLLDENAGDG